MCKYLLMSEVSEVADILKSLRQRAGLSVRKMAEEAGLSSASYSHYELRYKKPYLPRDKADLFADILQKRGVERSDVLALAGAADGHQTLEAPEALPTARTAMIDVHDVRASAGPGSVVESEDVIDRLSFPMGYLERLTKTHPRHLKIIGVKGESMDPTVKDDDVVMLDTSKTNLDFDGLFVLRFGDALHVKRIGRASQQTVMIISDNAAYPDREMQRSEVEAVGKVVWIGKKV